MIHGDLKAVSPICHSLISHNLTREFIQANILIDGQGRARISDFGLSLVRSHSTLVKQAETPVCGTAPWMAPELLKGGQITIASDVYGFAMTMYEVCHQFL